MVNVPEVSYIIRVGGKQGFPSHIYILLLLLLLLLLLARFVCVCVEEEDVKGEERGIEKEKRGKGYSGDVVVEIILCGRERGRGIRGS
ncbi:predicted protein [Sclerotinia sclerotiorum 1980 UF-70]|uniref:Uncharacterized protein n=1 Tax=Sclerotinia sclerotiorum (strain ATCC 18683 / 1980 / Ss-1) TaxID=665079 RepID=A7F9Z6_SCLS1|nr:predicted protein [Sclerotinia sclerotiorum 1980 UF-70]EDO00557.1 predicted protein [Sclerotinia sclerotiorum 1980 UF-70]